MIYVVAGFLLTLALIYFNRWMNVEPPPTLQPKVEGVTHGGFLSAWCGGAIVGDCWATRIEDVTCPKCRKLYRSRRNMKSKNGRRKS